jgi:hypothetical protein
MEQTIGFANNEKTEMGGGGWGWLSDYQISEKGCLNEFSCYFAMFLIDDT